MMPHFHPMTRRTKIKEDGKEDGKQQEVSTRHEAVHLSLAEEE